jgi:hypothetical protein
MLLSGSLKKRSGPILLMRRADGKGQNAIGFACAIDRYSRRGAAGSALVIMPSLRI